MDYTEYVLLHFLLASMLRIIMKSSSARAGLVISMGVIVACMLIAPGVVFAGSVVTITAGGLTATSTNSYSAGNGFATTTRAKVGDTIQYQLDLNGTPWVQPQINIFSTGSTTMSGAGAHWYYATTTTSDAAVWNDGAVLFKISVGGTTNTDATTTLSQADLAGANITFDKTGPTLSSVTWSDVDGSTEFSATDHLIFTFNETMATTTIAAGNVNTRLGLSGSHSFGTSPTVSWNTTGTVLTLTLGTSPTVADADTVNPSSAVYDMVGNAAVSSAKTITDDIAPLALSGNGGEVFHGSVTVTLASVGSSQIRYEIGGTTPTCSSGSVYSSPLTFSLSTILSAIGCDEHGNYTAVVTGTHSPSSGNGGGSVSTTSTTSVTTPAVLTTTTTHEETTTSAHTETAVANASGLSNAQIQSILDVLASFDADAATIASVKMSLQGTTGGSVTSNAVHVFKADLTIGVSLGSEVKALQQFLNAHNFTVSATGAGSAGNETTVFGSATKAALIKYQKAHNITPAVGYFGSKTRAAVNAGE